MTKAGEALLWLRAALCSCDDERDAGPNFQVHVLVPRYPGTWKVRVLRVPVFFERITVLSGLDAETETSSGEHGNGPSRIVGEGSAAKKGGL